MSDIWVRSFAEAFCAKYGCPQDAYETEVFGFCVPYPLGLFARAVDLWKPDFFRDDHDAIRRLGAARSYKEFDDELQDMFYVVQREGGFLRSKLGIRVSLRRLDRLRTELFG